MTDRQQAVKDALRLVGEGLSANRAAQQVGAEYGVGRQTVQAWAKKAGTPLGGMASVTAKNAREVAEVEYRARRARLRVDMLRVAEKVLGQIDAVSGPAAIREGVDKVGRAAQAFSVSLGILIDKIRLEEGEPTARTEHLGRDEFMAEVKRLAVEMEQADPARAVSH
jgi:hypothetical protein